MKKNQFFIFIAACVFCLSGCIISHTPFENPVALSYGEQKTFSIKVSSSTASYTWYADGAVVPGETQNSFTYVLNDVIKSKHKIKVIAKYSSSEDAYTWNVNYEGMKNNYVYLKSDPGDYVGGGGTYLYTQADSQISLEANGGLLSISIDGDEWWFGDFQEPNYFRKLRVGQYLNLKRYPFNEPLIGGLDWGGEGRGCNELTGSFKIDDVTYSGDTLTSIDLSFEQHCEGNTPALHGWIHWRSDDHTAPPGPVNPIPNGLWKPASGSTPINGNYVYLQIEPGDCYSGQSRTLTYTQANSSISLEEDTGYLSIRILGDEDWDGQFRVMNTLNSFEIGYYGNLNSYSRDNPTKARQSVGWYGNTGWFAIDNVVYTNGVLTAIDLRFEQDSCTSSSMRGEIHWRLDDPTVPPGPVNPPPAGLWEPVSGSTPPSGNYVYLQSDAGDYIGWGKTYTYTPDTISISVNEMSGHLGVYINGNDWWSGDFKTMSSLDKFQLGYYPDLKRFPFNNPARGGLEWGGNGCGCNTLTGWFVVDNVLYANNVLTSIDLRFEQHCEGGTPALHGKIHWNN